MCLRFDRKSLGFFIFDSMKNKIIFELVSYDGV